MSTKTENILPRFWKAGWIWPRDRREPNLHLLFRKDFELASVPKAAVLHIAAESSALVILNGKEVGRTSPNSYPHQHYYETYDIQSALTAGVNRLAVVARYIGIPSSASIPKDPGLLAELVIDETSIGSDASWRCLELKAWLGCQRRSEWLNLDQVEIVDRRLLPDGFPYPKDDSGFMVPESLPWPGVRFTCVEPRPFSRALPCGAAEMRLVRAGTGTDCSGRIPIPAMAVSEEEITTRPFSWDGYSPFTVPAQPADTVFSIQFSFEKYFTGRPELELEGPAGAVVDIAWEEKFLNGRIDVRDTRVYTADRHILAAGLNRIVPEDWIAGRALQLTFRNLTAPVKVNLLRCIREEYPLKRRLKFTSSNKKLERIVEISMNGARHCMHDNIMDCPWRERRQWIGDVQRISLINHYAFGDRNLVRGVLRQHIGMQDPTGRMWCCSPIWEEYPTQSMEWLRAVLEYTEFTGDRSLLEEVSGNIEMLHRWFLRNRDANGLLFIDKPPVMNWMDNPLCARLRLWQFKVPFLAQNLRYLLFLDDIAACFELLGRSADAQQVRAGRCDIESVIHAQFADADTGLLRDCPGREGAPRTFSVMGHALAVCTGIYPLPEAGQLWDKFQAYSAKHPDDIIPASPFGQFHVHQALIRLGRPDAAIADILEKWGPMVDAGADTTWEAFHDRTSHCHGWAGTPAVVLAGLILGLDPRRPGKVRKENVGGVDWMEAVIES